MRRALAVLVVILATGSALAQPASGGNAGNNSALAEQLFNQGRDLAKANQWADACPKFEASLHYDPVLGTKLNLATCYEHIGRLASAWGLYREAMEQARKAGDNKRADYAQKQATALEPRLPKLSIAVATGAPAGLIVKRDDTAVDAGALGVALYVDPGTHVVTASAPGYEQASITVSVAEGKTETVALPALVAKPAEPAAAEPTPVAAVHREEAPTGPRVKSRMYTAIGLGAAGVVAVGVGAVFGVKANSKYSDATKLCGSSLECPAASYDADKKLVSDARSSATLSTVLVGTGIAAIAAGAIVYFTAPRMREQRTAHLVPVPQDGGAGLALTGTF